MLQSILHVAEKPSVAKEAAKILSNNNFNNKFTLSKFNPVHEFEMNFQGNKTMNLFTSVTGHIINLEFHE